MDGQIHKDESPKTKWPVLKIGEHLLMVRWTFYVTWLLSKRKIDLLKMKDMSKNLDPAMIDHMLEIFAACVAENFPKGHAPDAEFWAMEISKTGDPELFNKCNAAITEAVGKAPRAVKPAAPPAEADQPATPVQTQ